MKPTQKPRRPYYNPEFLLKLYRWMEKYQERLGPPPPYSSIVAAGFCASTSTVRYFYDRMVELKMIAHTPYIACGVKLLPLAGADQIITNLLEKEKQNVNANG